MADPYADIASPDPYASIASPVAQAAAVNPFNRQVGADVSYGAPLGEGGASSLAAAGYGQQPSIVDQAKAVGGRADDLVRQIASGVTLGGADRLAAGAGAVTGVGGEQGDYSGNLAKQRAATESSAQELGAPATIAANLGGNVLGAAALPGGALALPASGLARALKLGGIGAGAGAIAGGLSSPDWTDTGQTARDVGIGAGTGGTLGIAVPAAAGLAGKLAAALRSTPAGQITADNIGALKNAAYKKVDDLGAAYSPEAYQGLVSKITQDAQGSNISADIHPDAVATIKNLQNTADAGQPITLTQLDQKRQMVNRDLGANPKPGERYFGNQIRNNIDDFIANAGPEHMAPMPGAAGAASAPIAPPQTGADTVRASLKESGVAPSGFDGDLIARAGQMVDTGHPSPIGAYYDALMESLRGEEAAPTATAPSIRTMTPEEMHGAAAPQVVSGTLPAPMPQGPVASGQDAAAAIANARDLNTRYAKSQKLADALSSAELRAGSTNSGGNIDNATRQNLRRVFEKGNFTPDETDQYTRAIIGGPVQNAVRMTGKMLNPSGFVGMSELAALLAGHPLAAGVAGVGYGAKKAADRMTQANVQKLMATILAGGKAPATVSAPSTKAAMAAVLAGSAGPQELRRQGLLPR